MTCSHGSPAHRRVLAAGHDDSWTILRPHQRPHAGGATRPGVGIVGIRKGTMGAEVDTLDVIGRFERELAAGATHDRRTFLVAILARWQNDPDLTAESRRRAGEVLRRAQADRPIVIQIPRRAAGGSAVRWGTADRGPDSAIQQPAELLEAPVLFAQARQFLLLLDQRGLQRTQCRRHLARLTNDGSRRRRARGAAGPWPPACAPSGSSSPPPRRACAHCARPRR